VTDDPQPTNGNVLTATDVTALVSLMSGMLDRMESRIIARLDDNSRLASERWAKHDAELAENTKRVVKRFEVVEADLLTVSNCLKGHLDKEHDEELASEIRVRPVKSIGRFVVANWKDILILVIGVLAVLGVLGIEWRSMGGG
jgi:hypothetical protein